MITEYHKPTQLEECVNLLNRPGMKNMPLAGGTLISQNNDVTPTAAIDINGLGWDKIIRDGEVLEIGSTAKLADLEVAELVPSGLKQCVKKENNLHMRNMVSIGGTLISANGHSPLLTALLALDAKLKWTAPDVEIGIAEWLQANRKTSSRLLEKMRIAINIPLSANFLARSPEDEPQVTVVVCKSGLREFRVAVGVVGLTSPFLVKNGGEGSSSMDWQFSLSDKLSGHPLQKYLLSVIPTMIKRLVEELN